MSVRYKWRKISRRFIRASTKIGEELPIFPRATITDGVVSQNFEQYTIYKDQPFAVRFERDAAYLTPILPDEAKGTVPDTYVFATNDLANMEMKFVMDGDVKR